MLGFYPVFIPSAYVLFLKIVLIPKIILLKVRGIGISPLLPVAPVIRVISELDLLDPLDPLVPPFVLCDQLERIAPFRREGDMVHLIGYEDVMVHQVVKRKGCCIAIMRREYHGICTGIDACIPDQIADQHALPEDRCIPAFHAEERDNLGIMGVPGQYILVRVDICCVGQPAHREPVIGYVDILGTPDRVFTKIIH